MRDNRYIEILRGLSVREKCALLTGDGAFGAKGCEAAGIGPLRLSDGPSGVRDGTPSVCYPSACLIACSFDCDTAEQIGAMLGEDCRRRGIGLLLGPAQNLKRLPVCGRNFEYYSEDPCLSGELAASFVRGLQRRVSACVKHYAANNQESLRMTVNCLIDRRTLNETYLSSFRRVVQKSEPDAVMTSYNKINGEYVAENEYVSHKILREKWGYCGLVISDWGAVDDAVKAFRCGLVLEMPENPSNTKKLEQAVELGEISLRELDERAAEYLAFAEKAGKKLKSDGGLGNEKRTLAELVAESFVLLKNDGNILPLTGRKKIGVFGEFARSPRIQGGGCANVPALSVGEPFAEICGVFADCDVRYEQGYRTDGKEDTLLLKRARALAKESDVCVVFLGLPEEWESEGYDRKDINIPENQIRFLKNLYRANREIVVLLLNGGTVSMEWDKYCKGLLECYLAGSALASAAALALCGKVSPCGRLAETVLNQLSDSSAYPYFQEGKEECTYNEGLFVGYKYYTSKGVKVHYPFGYGLTYGEVRYSDFRTAGRNISFVLHNDGDRLVKETVQVYIGYKSDVCPRPVRELKLFRKVSVPARNSVKVCITPDDECFWTYDENRDEMRICGGEYTIAVAKNAQEVLFENTIRIDRGRKVFGRNSRIGEFSGTMAGNRIIEQELKPYLCKAIIGNFNAEVRFENGRAKGMPMFDNVMQNMPLRALINLTAGAFTEEKLEWVLQELNGMKEYEE